MATTTAAGKCECEWCGIDSGGRYGEGEDEGEVEEGVGGGGEYWGLCGVDDEVVIFFSLSSFLQAFEMGMEA